MDLSRFDLKTASEKGSWVTLEYDGQPLGDEGKPCQLHIRGIGDPKVMAACKTVLRVQAAMQDRLARSSDKDVDRVLKTHEVKLEDANEAMLIAAIDDWQNVEWDGEPLTFNNDNLLKICGKGTLFYKQVTTAILEEKRLFTNAAQD